VMGIEAFAEAALCIHPGWHIDTIQEVNFLAPFKFYKDEPRTVIIEAILRPFGDGLVADCRLLGRRTLPGQPEPQETLHFTSQVRLARQLPEAIAVPEPRLSGDAIVDAAQIYRIYFHGPAYQVLDRAWWDGRQVIGEMATNLPVNHNPAEQPTLMAPRLIELCLQTAGICEIGATSRMGLPMRIDRVSWSRPPQTAEGRLYALVTPNPEQTKFDAEVVDAKGNVYVRVDGYCTTALPNGIDPELLKPLQAAVSPEATAAATNDLSVA